MFGCDLNSSRTAVTFVSQRSKCSLNGEEPNFWLPNVCSCLRVNSETSLSVASCFSSLIGFAVPLRMRFLSLRFSRRVFFISLLFSVHPLFTDAIAWIPGRGDLLSGLFCLASFLSFIYYNNSYHSLSI